MGGGEVGFVINYNFVAITKKYAKERIWQLLVGLYIYHLFYGHSDCSDHNYTININPC